MKKLLFISFTVVAQLGCAEIKTTVNCEDNFYSQIESLDDARAYIVQFPERKYKKQLLERTFPLVSKVSYQYTKSKRYQLRQQDFIYNDKGKLLIQRDSLGFGETYTYRLKYNSDRQLVKKTTINNTSLQNTVTYEYNNNGQKIKELDEYTNGGESERFLEYSENGLLLAHYIDKNNEKIESYTYSYDTHGNKQFSNNISRTGVTGTHKGRSLYTYNSQNNMTEESFSGGYFVDGKLKNTNNGTREFVYDARNNLIEENYEYESTSLDNNGSSYYLASTTVYIRDNSGLLLEERHMKTLKKNTEKQLDRTLKYQYIYIQLQEIL
ncbi:hypothetical protein [Vibrio sp. F74]|uniref:hypothetical protein n=1 Tax=Vibrio sp. F74 TaxID=700020 RepID=UPI0035F5F4B7